MIWLAVNHPEVITGGVERVSDRLCPVARRIILKWGHLARGNDGAHQHAGPHDRKARDYDGEYRQFLGRGPPGPPDDFADDDHEGYDGKLEDGHAGHSEFLDDHPGNRIHFNAAEEEDEPGQDDVERREKDQPQVEVGKQDDRAVASPAMLLRKLFRCDVHGWLPAAPQIRGS